MPTRLEQSPVLRAHLRAVANMGHQFPPPAPPPPPAMPQGMFPGMDQLGQDFGHTHIETIEPRFETARFDDRPPRGGRGVNPRRASEGNTKSLVSYEGYIFTKNRAEHAGQKETWAYVRRTSMPISQTDMKDQVQRQYKKGMTAMKQYEASEMQGFKRRQVDRLIEDRERRDDPNFQYHLASIKLEQRRLRSGKYENGTMRVILRRQLRPGIPFHPAMAPVGPPPSNEIIDITGQEESERSSLDSFGSSPKLHHGPFPLPRQHSEPWGHVPQVIDEAFMAHHGPPRGEEQSHGHGPFFAEEHSPGGHGAKDKKNDNNDQHRKEEKSDKKDKHDKKDKSEKRDKRPELHQSHSHKSDKKHHSDISSLDSDWDQLSGHTEDTFETFPSTSGGSKTYKKEKKHDKHDRDDHHKTNSHHGSRDREPQRPLYREHTRKVPEKPRDLSPVPSRRSNRSGSHYVLEEDVYIQPEVSHRGGRERQREPRARQVSYSRERPVRRQPQRGMSYDDEPFDFEYDEPRSATYAKKIARLPKAPQVDYEKERLKLELERERSARERERREKDMLDRELDRTAGELDRTTAELHRNTRMQMPMRERLPPRERRQPLIIERGFPPMPRPSRVPEPLYDDYDDYDYLAQRY